MYFLYNYEYGTLKPMEITLRRKIGDRENKGRDKPIWGTIHVYMELSQ
jgi:hypothetical protein